jgi:Zn-finger nucleic acid-binding protein
MILRQEPLRRPARGDRAAPRSQRRAWASPLALRRRLGYGARMQCPRDGSPLSEQRYEADIQVDACAACGGVWLDDGELEAIQESAERDYTKDIERMPELIGPKAARSEGLLACPKCGAEMAAQEYAHCSAVVIDVCPEGHGVWLDGGELRALEVFFERARREARSEDAALWAVRGFWVSLKARFRGKR